MEDALVFIQDELHYLVLEDHEHGDVGRLRLWPQQSWPKDDGHILHRHAIVIPVMDHPVTERKNNVTSLPSPAGHPPAA